MPIVHDVVTELGATVAIIGFGFPDDNFHAAYEKLHLPRFLRGIELAIYYYEELASGLEGR